MAITEKELFKCDAKRDIGAELFESVTQMKRGEVRVVYSSAIAVRQKVGLSQTQFALLLGVSVRTLQGWEQGRIEPSGAAKTLLKIAQTNPDALRAVA